jgi:hypothetical protein
MHRSFKSVSYKKSSGSREVKPMTSAGEPHRAHSRGPGQAAMKIFGAICKKFKGSCTIDLTIQETTSGSAKKEFVYRLKRVKDEKVVERDGKEIVFKYQYKIKSIK